MKIKLNSERNEKRAGDHLKTQKSKSFDDLSS